MTDAEHTEGSSGNEREPDSPYMWTEFTDVMINNPELAEAVLNEIHINKPGYFPKHLLAVDGYREYALVGICLSLAILIGRFNKSIIGVVDTNTEATEPHNYMIDLHAPRSFKPAVVTGPGGVPNPPFIFVQYGNVDDNQGDRSYYEGLRAILETTNSLLASRDISAIPDPPDMPPASLAPIA